MSQCNSIYNESNGASMKVLTRIGYIFLTLEGGKKLQRKYETGGTDYIKGSQSHLDTCYKGN